jgi:UDP-glucose 4-epimerase
VSDLVRARLDALCHLREGGESVVLNCGYGKGFSVLDVIEAVKRASGTDFTVRYAPRRPGDAAALVMGAGRIHDVLGWEPRLDNLDTIVEGAFS